MGQEPGQYQGLALSFLRTHSQEACQGEAEDRYKQKRLYFLSFYIVLGSLPGNSQTVSHLIIITTL
jgi:hypothetical protein